MIENLKATVCIKNVEGIANFTDKSMEWKPIDVNNVSNDEEIKKKCISINWNTIEEQQVSSMTSSKAMIRLKLTNKTTMILEFINDHQDLSTSFHIRNKAKNIISYYINQNNKNNNKNNHRMALCSEIELKNRAILLAKNNTLKYQHTEMVEKGLISEEDFWSCPDRKELLLKENSKRQKIGKTSNILIDLNDNTNNTNNKIIKYNLNKEIIQQIFVQYPTVYRAYKTIVPEKMNEVEFWSVFFKSKYFHKDRNESIMNGHEDIFTKYELEEEKEKEEKYKKLNSKIDISDSLIDLLSTEKDTYTINNNNNNNKYNTRKLDTFSKYNRHSANVLGSASDIMNYDKNNYNVNKRKRNPFHDTIEESIKLDDLENNIEPEFIPLTLEDQKRYFHHTNKTNSSLKSNKVNDNNTIYKDTDHIEINLSNAFPTIKDGKYTFDYINNMLKQSQNEQRAGTSSYGMIAKDIPADFRTQMYQHFYDINELMKHFIIFKNKITDITNKKIYSNQENKDNLTKFHRIKDKMGQKFEMLRKVRQNLPSEQRNRLAPLLKPFDDQLNLAFIESYNIK